MARGDNHAKQIVIGEANCLVTKLQNGDAGCVKTQGRAIALLVKMITPLYEAEFVTVQECESKHSVKTNTGITKLKLGPFEVQGQITTAVIFGGMPFLCCAGLLFVLGKTQNWW